MALVDKVNAHIRDLAPYVPGKPMEELERELGIVDSVKLASNENPFGPSPRAMEAIRAASGDVHRYPDGACFALRRRMSQRLGVAEEQLTFGCGADELLELLAKTLLAPGDEVVYPWPSFAMYPIVITGMGGKGVAVPLRDDLVHDLPAMLAAVNDRTKIVFLCNPNNPTGTSFGSADFDEFVRELPGDVVLVVDEAYREFVRRKDFPDSIVLTRRRPGTIVLRTFSKVYGLAGLRVGYGIADPELASYLERARHPFNVNRLAEVAALAALDDEEHVRRTLEGNAAGIEYLTRELTALGCEVWPSDANFLLTRTGTGYYDRLLRLGIIVRPLNSFGMEDCLRISVGTAEENERLIKMFHKLAEEGA